MRRNDNFTFRVGDIERAMIADLARRLRRSQGDAIRLVIREAVFALQAQTDAPAQPARQADAARRGGAKCKRMRPDPRG
ncbi:MAG: hypothetical protein HY741_14055 [Chloroflexi bacterium]|nr:hypothetical protein [Chloroflexota bacterium]